MTISDIQSSTPAALADAIIVRKITRDQVKNALAGNPKLTEVMDALSGRMEGELKKLQQSKYQEDYKDFLAVYPDYYRKAELMLQGKALPPRPADVVDWRALDKTNAESLICFQNKYPNSVYASDAKTALRRVLESYPEEERDWYLLNKSDVVELIDYKSDYPESKHIEEVEDRIQFLAAKMDADERAWVFLDRNNIESVEKYIRDFQHSEHAETAKELLKKLENNLPEEEKLWRQLDKNNYDGIVGFIKEYPSSPRLEEAAAAMKRLEDSFDDEEREWYKNLDKKNRDALVDYLDKYPASRHAGEAQNLIEQLEVQDEIYDDDYLLELINNIREDKLIRGSAKLDALAGNLRKLIEDGKLTREKISDFVCVHPNALTVEEINVLQKKALVSNSKLEDGGIDSRFIKAVKNARRSETFKTPDKIKQISGTSTEVYFWGLPSSGKSCAIGAILSVANNGNVADSMECNQCQGYDYMSQLVSNFSATEEVAVLPPGTKITSTYEMSFDLHDNRNQVHPITIVDLAGELIRCFHLVKAGNKLDEEQQEAWDTLQSLLVSKRSENRKIHFFVIEYGAERNKYDNVAPDFYLQAVAKDIDQMGLFRHDTDAIYVMITKVDKTGLKGRALEQKLRGYINNYYKGFCNTLSEICSANNINGKKLLCIPFSLGRVCFSDLCIFDDKPAANVVRELLVRSAGISKSKIRGGLAK